MRIDPDGGQSSNETFTKVLSFTLTFAIPQNFFKSFHHYSNHESDREGTCICRADTPTYIRPTIPRYSRRTSSESQSKLFWPDCWTIKQPERFECCTQSELESYYIFDSKLNIRVMIHLCIVKSFLTWDLSVLIWWRHARTYTYKLESRIWGLQKANGI